MTHTLTHGRDRNLAIAVGINVLLTLAQAIGGVISGSLSLVADALHNLSDAASLGIALEAHIVVTTNQWKQVEIIKAQLKQRLQEQFGISHSTLEFEHHLEANCNEL